MVTLTRRVETFYGGRPALTFGSRTLGLTVSEAGRSLVGKIQNYPFGKIALPRLPQKINLASIPRWTSKRAMARSAAMQLYDRNRIGDAVEADPTYLPALERIALHDLNHGLPGKASFVFERILVLDPYNYHALTNLPKLGEKLGKNKQAQERVPRLSEEQLKAVFLFDEGVELRENGHEAEAVRKWEEAITLFPEYDRPHGCLGIWTFNQGRFEAAKAHFFRQLSVNPADAVSLFLLGEIYHGEKKSRLARALYEQAFEERPVYASAGLGDIGAQALLRRWQTLTEKEKRAEKLVGKCFKHYNAGDFKSLLAILNKAQKLAPGEPEITQRIADAYRELADAQSAANDYEQAANNYGMAIEKYDAAIKLFEKIAEEARQAGFEARRLEENNQQCHFAMALGCLRPLGSSVKDIEEYVRRGAGLLPHEAVGHLILGSFLMENHRIEEAIEPLNQALRLPTYDRGINAQANNFLNKCYKELNNPSRESVH